MSSSVLDNKLLDFCAECVHDPLLFSRAIYPWGEGDLKNSKGPRQWQLGILDMIGKHLRNPQTRFKPLLLAVASGHGIGKLFSYDTVVPVPSGERRWGDLSLGDLVFGADGNPTEIIGIRHYKSVPMYRVTFDDGSFADVSSGHLWTVRGRHERRNKLKTWRTVETIDLVKMGVLRKNGIAMARQWEIPIQGSPRFEEREIDIHPYVVGVWIGDGTKGCPCYTKPSDEIKNKIEDCGYEVSTASDGKGHRILGVAELFSGGIFDLESHERYIPDDYKFNTVENRMALFQGLCDTDGEVHAAGSIGYSTTSKRLAEDIVWLARSLGGKATIQAAVKKGWYPDENGGRIECRDCYRVTINVPFNPFTLRHRREKYKPSEHRYLSRWIDSIEPLPEADGMCIEVAAPDGLYQANDFIVTHNSSLISMIINWGLSTMPDTRIVATANTETQLRSKTWPEVSKWMRLSATSHWFKTTATSVYSLSKGHDSTWSADAIPWSDNNTEAFAGLHNEGRRIILIFDEGSAISEKVFDVAEGAMTDANTEIIWLVFGNPTRNSGRFRDLFGKFKHRWITKQIDSRTVEGTNKELIAQWVRDYGEDSDFVRVRVRGEFPRAGSMQFIGSDLVEAARIRYPEAKLQDPLVMGVDVARFGDDETVICLRRGRDAKSVPWIKLRGKDNVEVADIVMNLAGRFQPDRIFVDGGGPGAGVVDILKRSKFDIQEVQFGAAASSTRAMYEGDILFANKRAEMWGKMKDWLRGGMIPDDAELATQLTSVEYGYVVKDGVEKIQLEKKADMKKRGLASPDAADALCLCAGTMIKTPNGDVPIENINPGDMILTPLGVSRVAIKWESLTNSLTTVKFSNGKTLCGKGEHKIFTWNNHGQVRLDALPLTIEVEPYTKMRRMAWLTASQLFTKVRNIGFKALVDILGQDIQLTASGCFIAAFGLTIMGLYQKIITSIIRIMTGETITFPILSLNQHVNTDQNICEKDSGVRINTIKTCNIFHWLESKLQNGINLQKAFHGIKSTAKKLGKTKNLLVPFVQYAERHTGHFSLHDQDFALMLVNRLKAIKGLLKALEPVFFVVSRLLRIFTGIQSVVPVSVRTESAEPTIVYNLTLYQDNAYYANDILVFNCLTFAYPVMPSDHRAAFENKVSRHTVEYNPLSREHIAPDVGTGYNPYKR